MAQETYDKNDDAEYHFSDDDAAVYEPQEEQQASSTESSAAPTIPHSQIMKRRAVAVIFGVLFSIFIVYKLFSMLFSGSEDKTTSKISAPAVKTSSSHSTGQEMQSQLLKSSSINLPPSQSKDVSLLSAKKKSAAPKALQKEQKPEEETSEALSKERRDYLANLQQQNEEFITRLEHQQLKNQEKVDSLENKISSLEGGLNSLDNSISGLTMQLQRNEVKQKTLDAYKARFHQSKEQVIRENKRYFVKAVIPGRAWLVGADGSALTVRVGNIIPGYGKVVGINSYDGTVSTGSGVKLYYGSSDR